MSTGPEHEYILGELAPLIVLVHSALEDGTFKAQKYFKNEEVDIDCWLAPNLVRFWAKKKLEKAGHDVKEEEEEDFELERVANNGLVLSYRDYHIRILKSFDGGPPVPGPSKKKQDFYNQQQIDMFDDTSSNDGQGSSPLPLKLIILWDVDAGYNLQDLRLACPKAGDLTRASVQVHWNVPIPHAALFVDAVAEVHTETEEDDDLPISLARSDKAGEEDAG